MKTEIGFVKESNDVNPFDYMAKNKKVWIIMLADGSTFDKYPTKSKALADADKYNITIIG